jgi:O-antigen ligase
VRILAFVAGVAVVLIYALRGGTYDVVARHEAGIAIWWVLAIGFAAGVLPRARLPRLGLVVAAGFAALAGWTLLALTWTESDEKTFIEAGRVLHHLGVVLLAASLLTRRTWTWACAGLAAGAGLVAGLAVLSRLFPGSFPHDAVQGAFGGNRLSHPLNYWNAVACWATMTAAICAAWAGSSVAVARSVALAFVPVAATAGYLTYSRQAAIGMAIAGVLVWALSRGRAVTLIHLAVAAAASALPISAVRSHPAVAALVTGSLQLDSRWLVPRRAARLLLAAGAVTVVVAGAVVLPSAGADAWREFRNQTTTTATTSGDPAARLASLNGNRTYLFDSALRAYESRPLKGRGPGTFQFWWSRDGTTGERVRDAHSLYLEALAESGWPGLLLLLLALGSCAAVALLARVRATTRGEAVAATAVTAAFAMWAIHAGIDWMWESTANTTLALLGVGAAIAGLSGEEMRPSRVPRFAAAAAALIVGLSLLPDAVSTSAIRDSQRDSARNRLTQAFASATEAVDTTPWAATPYLQRGLISEQRGQPEPAIVDLRRAIQREPTNWRLWVVMARLEAQAGRPAAALEAWRRSRELLRVPFFGP